VGARSSRSGAVARALAGDGTEDLGAHEEEPWEGYSQMRVEEITQRLRRESTQSLAAVHAYEQAHKQRKGVLAGIDRELARRSR